MKNIKREDIYCYVDWINYAKPISEIRKDLDDLEKKGITHIEITTGTDWDSGTVVGIKTFYNRLETDDEYNERVRIENARLERIKKEELRQLEILKAKYENNNETN